MDERASHTIPPFFDICSEVLILGSFPSVRSRADGFYYAHPQNRFWRVLSGIFGDDPPTQAADKKRFLCCRKIALWDVIGECRVRGSSDATIRDVIPNDITTITSAAPIRLIALNGATAARLYKRYRPDIEIESISLPSTSPANASWSLDRLIAAWRTAWPDL